MRVFFFNNCFPSSQNPNIGTYAKTIADIIEEAGFEVQKHVLVRQKSKWIDYFKFYISLTFMRFPNKEDILYINHCVFLLPLIFRQFFYKRKTIYHWHGEELINDSFLFRSIRYLMVKTFTKDSIHISPSEYYKTIIINRLYVEEKQIIVSPSGGIDMKLFKERTLPDDSDIHIGFPAALSEHKGVQYLYEILQNKELLEQKIGKKIFIHIIDYGSESSKFKEFVSHKYDNSVSILPVFEKSKMFNFYKNIHITLFLSKRESLGLTVLESMACGVPVLARNICSMSEMVISGITGELVNEYPSINEIADRLAQMANKLDSYQPRKFVQENYNREGVIISYKKILAAL